LGTGLLTWLLLPLPYPSQANPVSWQNPCGVIDEPQDIGFPLDPQKFSLIQPFARPNGRFEGQLHAGEDWIHTGGETYGQAVRAIAPGRVSFSDPEAWGLDKGVLILQHQLADGSTFYSLYGHMEEVNEISFAANGTCVNKGDVVGAIGSPRPAPHLHFEIRNFGGNFPGPGYWEVDPRTRGWQHPRQFILNWQAWLSPSHVWHRTLLDPTGPRLPNITRADGIILMLDDKYLRAYSNAGRLWEFRLADSLTPVGFVPVDDTQLIIASADGRLQYWNPYGGYLTEWNPTIGPLDQAPVSFGELLFVRNTANELYVYRGRDLVGHYVDTPPFVSVAQTHEMLAIITEKPELILFDTNGEVIQRHVVNLASDVIATPEGIMYLRDQGSFERVDSQGRRTVLLDELSVNRSDRAMLIGSDGHIIMWGINGRERLMAVTPAGEIVWAVDVTLPPNDSPILNARLVQANACTLALADRRGRLMSFDLATGQPLGGVSLWGLPQNQVWLGAFPGDEILKIHVGDMLAGFDTRILSGRACSAG
jgi:hypothetical protein